MHQQQQPPSRRATESESNLQQKQKRSRRRRSISIQSHLLWRSFLGAPAAWSGSCSNSRGVYLLLDDNVTEDHQDDQLNGKSRIRGISSNKRTFHLLVCSLRDVVLHNIGNNRLLDNDDNVRLSRHNNNRSTLHGGHSYLQLLPQPRIVGAPHSRHLVDFPFKMEIFILMYELSYIHLGHFS